MLNWQVGAVKITCVVETVIPFPDGSLLLAGRNGH